MMRKIMLCFILLSLGGNVQSKHKSELEWMDKYITLLDQYTQAQQENNQLKMAISEIIDAVYEIEKKMVIKNAYINLIINALNTLKFKQEKWREVLLKWQQTFHVENCLP